MALTVSTLLQRAYRELGQLNISVATGGSTTTVVDTKLTDTGGEDDAWKDGILIVTRDAAGASAAPEGEFNRISAYVDSSGTFTVDTAFTAAVASGDRYAYSSPLFPFYQMIEFINDGLTDLGDIALVDTTTLDSASSQTEYANSVAWKSRPPTRIDIQGQTGDANDNRWQMITNWEIVPAAPGSTGLIVFKEQLQASRDLRIWYTDKHPRVQDFDDAISETIEEPLAVAAVVEKALIWYNNQLEGDEIFWLSRLNDAKVTLERMKSDNPIWKPEKFYRTLHFGHADYRTSEVNKAHLG